MKNLLMFLVSSIIAVTACYGQIPIGKHPLGHLLKKSPAFTIYKDNYFITGTGLGEEPSRDNSDAKFQFSFKQQIFKSPLSFNTYLFLTYTQKSFWNIYKSSSPFAETNYNPGIILLKPLFRDDKLSGSLGLSLEHESNGRDSVYSRSWNSISLSYNKHFSRNLSVALKIWLPFLLNDNPDLMEYIGYTEAQLQWVIKEDRFYIDITARKSASWDWKGSLLASLSFKPFKSRNQYLTLQRWQGYAESLIDYKQNRNVLRIGVVLKPTFYRFY